MKFFTHEWRESGSPNAEAVFKSYDSYLCGVRAYVSPSLIELEESHTLHDAEVKFVGCEFIDRTISLLLHGWDQELKFKVAYSLQFSGVTQFEQSFPQEEFVESELGDLAYWECEWLNPETEVRMLFVSGAQVRIVFGRFTFEHVRRET